MGAELQGPLARVPTVKGPLLEDRTCLCWVRVANVPSESGVRQEHSSRATRRVLIDKHALSQELDEL